jgi:hypothetical protein
MCFLYCPTQHSLTQSMSRWHELSSILHKFSRLSSLGLLGAPSPWCHLFSLPWISWFLPPLAPLPQSSLKVFFWKPSLTPFFFFFFSYWTGVWTRASHLQSRHSTTEPYPQFILLWLCSRQNITNYLPRLTSNCNPTISASQVARNKGVSHWRPTNSSCMCVCVCVWLVVWDLNSGQVLYHLSHASNPWHTYSSHIHRAKTRPMH